MGTRDEIVEYLNDFLSLQAYPDYGPMGLQFAGEKVVTHIATAVSASADVIEETANRGCQMLVVHHGLFWNNESRILDGRVGGRIDLLEEENISLLGYHLALDAHPIIGNNILAARRLGISDPAPFAEIGFGGILSKPETLADFRRRVYNVFQNVPILYSFGPKMIDRVATITGGAAQYISEAANEGYDAFVTGEAAEPTIYMAQEYGMHFFAAGHHATERLGIKMLGSKLEKQFGIKHTFIDVENPV